MAETAAVPNSTETSAPVDASATLLAPATPVADTTQQTQTAETPAAPAAEATVEEAAKPADEAAAPVVPETYTFTAPEGTAYDPAVLDAFSGAAKEAGLTQDAAQKLIDKMAPAIAARQVDQVQAIQKEWQDTSSSDAEFGGANLAANLGVARKALDNFATPELRTLLEQTGLGNHPEVIRLLYRAGKAISEDKFVGGNASGAGKATAAAVLYDKTPEAK